MRRSTSVQFVCLFMLAAGLLSAAQNQFNHYAIILSDAPVARQAGSTKDLLKASAIQNKQAIRSRQAMLAADLRSRRLAVTGSVQTVLNAVFVIATPEQMEIVRHLPGVAAVQKLQRLKPLLNTAINLVGVPAAWTALGGVGSAGTGVKIGIIDSGIDQTHPAFQDSSLTMPSGYPKCTVSRGECAYTTVKVIAARSYVQMLSLEFGGDPADTRPDDFSPRDHIGHGTAVAMAAAGAQNDGPLASITGVAPKAYIGNYKVIGSPGVNDFPFSDAVIQAIDDAVNDGMDILAVAVGTPAVWGPQDSGQTCGLATGPCDPLADAVQNASSALGVTVVVPAGNDGDSALNFPSYTSINSPGTAAAAITVGATTNSHTLVQTVKAASGSLNTLFGNGPKPASPLTARVIDSASTGNDGYACSALPSGALSGAIALIQRGNCQRDTKVNNAQQAGAVGVIIYQDSASGDGIFPMGGMQNTGIPAVLIGNTDGMALKQTIAANANTQVTLDPTFRTVDSTAADQVAYFSSYGPSLGNMAIKPELAGVGSDIYTATQNYDPAGDLYHSTRYIGTQGTSFSTALVAGAAALVKQKFPNYKAAQIKSALVNTATAAVTDFDSNGNPITARVTAVGAGKLNASEALKASVTVEPATVSFGVVGLSALTQVLTLRNNGASPVTLSLTVQPRDSDSRAQVRLSGSQFTIAGGQSAQVTVSLSGNSSAPGTYEGVISVQGAPSALRIPYLYLVPDGVPYNTMALPAGAFVGVAGQSLTTSLVFKVLDQYGVPVPNVPVVFASTIGGGSIQSGTPATDNLGIAEANVMLGAQPGDQEFTAAIQGFPALTVYFDGVARPGPQLHTDSSGVVDGVVNAASQLAGSGLAPGSYISIFGSGLSDSTLIASTPYLPVSLAGVNVSFDIQSQNISVPGHLSFVSPGQVNLQVPWELQGQTSAQMKVSLGDFSTQLYSVNLADYSPAAFEFTDSTGGGVVAAALDEKNVLVTSAHPVQRGHVVQLYANGAGPVTNQPLSGEVAPAQPLASTRVVPNVNIGGVDAVVIFSGLAPNFVGLYQINAIVPQSAPVGIQPLIITANGISSKTSQLAIQ